MARGPWQTLRARDPNWFTLRRAARAAVVVPVDFAIGSQLIGNAQVATFAAFGSFALLLFVSFRGDRVTRAGGYLVLGVAGVLMIVIGSRVTTPDWLAVVAMAVVSFAVLFAGVTSSMINAGTQATLLAFILSVMLPGGWAAVPDRLAGWGIAFAVSVPVALYVWPDRNQDALRARTAALCRALGAMLDLTQPEPGQGDSLVAMRHTARELRTAFRASATWTAALSTGARLLIRLVDELDWLATAVTNACADAPDGWPEQGRRLRDTAAQVMRSCAATLEHGGAGPTAGACSALESHIAALQRAREAVADEALSSLRGAAVSSPGATLAGEFERPLYAAHELGYAVWLAARTVSAIAAADSRSWWARLTGRRPVGEEAGALSAAQRVASGHLDRRSVWLQNSVRGAVGLTLAVLLSRIFDAQNAFWIGLGALSVLRSNALSTGATVARALAGTAAGFAVGGALVAVIGTDHAVLWTLLPLVILVAASAPAVISFVAGQAAFTVFTIILFNIIAPAGWQIGVVRVEDVALGCAASLLAGVLFWPRGAAAALGAAYGQAYRTAAVYLRQSLDATLGRRVDTDEGAAAATAAAYRLDDALRQYLAERGAKHVPLESVAALANGAARLRLAGTAIARLRDAAPEGRVVPVGASGGSTTADGLAAPVEVLSHRADEVTRWYEALGDGFDGRPGALPAVDGWTSGESLLDVVLPAVDRCGDPERAARAEQLLWSGQYLGDVDQLRGELLGPAEQVSVARARSWWRR